MRTEAQIGRWEIESGCWTWKITEAGAFVAMARKTVIACVRSREWEKIVGEKPTEERQPAVASEKTKIQNIYVNPGAPLLAPLCIFALLFCRTVVTAQILWPPAGLRGQPGMDSCTSFLTRISCLTHACVRSWNSSKETKIKARTAPLMSGSSKHL